jgi:AraC family transcriptional regulator, transcriptional activator FtrA
LARMPYTEQIMPNSHFQRPGFNSRVVALVYDGLCSFEFSSAAEIFGLPRPELGPDWYQFESCSASGGNVRGQYGINMTVRGGLKRLATAGTIIVPGWQGVDIPVPAEVIAALRKAHSRGVRLLSICSGAFVLAATGLLDGKRATTHWRYAAELQSRYPKIRVDADVLYVDEGQILTSAGSAAGLDLCLHLVRRDYGPRIANRVARRLVIPPHRDGGQAQFVERQVENHDRGSLSVLMDSIRRRLAEPLRIAELAKLAAMSERTFMRRFRAVTGMSPANWITSQRVDRARELLESTSLSIEQIAARTGLGGATTLRHHFRLKVGTSPNGYRQRFSRAARPGVRRRSQAGQLPA